MPNAIDFAEGISQAVGTGVRTWRDILEGYRTKETANLERTRAETERALAPGRIALQNQAVNLGAAREAVTREQLEQMKRDQEPHDINRFLPNLGYTPEQEKGVRAWLQAGGYLDENGMGQRGRLREGIKALYGSDFGKKLASDAANYYSQAAIAIKSQLDKALSEGGMVKDPEKVRKLQAQYDQVEQKLALHGGMSQAIREQMEARQAFEEVSKDPNITPNQKSMLGMIIRSGGKAADIRAAAIEILKEQQGPKPLSDIGKLQHDREQLIKSGIPENDPRIKAIDAEIENKGSGGLGDLEKKRKFFEQEYPQWAGKFGSSGYASAFEKWRAQEASKINVSVAGAEAKGVAYGKNRPLRVFDTKEYQPTYKTEREMEKEPGRYIELTEGSKALKQINLLEDIRGSIDLVRDSLNKPTVPFDEVSRLKIFEAFGDVDPKSAISNFIKGKFGKSLNTEQKQYLADLANLGEQMMAMRQTLGMGQGAQDMREAIRATIPGKATFDKEYANIQLDNATKLLDRLNRYIMKVPPRPGTEKEESGKGTKDKYTTGKIYTNAQGKQAKYLGDGKWQLLE